MCKRKIGEFFQTMKMYQNITITRIDDADLLLSHCSYIHFLFDRFSVEVADFNFGESSSVDLEYKTFHRRLLDSIRELIRRHPITTNEPIESTDSSLRYGTMT